mgnify:CR=1 FL=1
MFYLILNSFLFFSLRGLFLISVLNFLRADIALYLQELKLLGPVREEFVHFAATIVGSEVKGGIL